MSPTKDVQFYSGSLMNQHSQVYDPSDVTVFSGGSSGTALPGPVSSEPDPLQGRGQLILKLT